MKRFLLLFSLFLVAVTYAQDNELTKTDPFQNSVGIRFSNISGYGLSFSRRFLENYTIKATGIIFYDEYVKGYKDSIIQDTKNIIYDYGFELQRDIYKTEGSRVYALGGMYFSKEQDKQQERIWPGNVLQTSTDDNYDRISGGLGIGIEFIIKKRFGINIDFGYKFEHSDGEEFENGSKLPVEENTTTVGLGLGFSYIY